MPSMWCAFPWVAPSITITTTIPIISHTGYQFVTQPTRDSSERVLAKLVCNPNKQNNNSSIYWWQFSELYIFAHIASDFANQIKPKQQNRMKIIAQSTTSSIAHAGIPMPVWMQSIAEMWWVPLPVTLSNEVFPEHQSSCDSLGKL